MPWTDYIRNDTTIYLIIEGTYKKIFMKNLTAYLSEIFMTIKRPAMKIALLIYHQ